MDETQANEGECGAHDRFNVVVLYDRAEAGRRAMNQLRKVTDPLAEGLDLQVRLWRLDVVMDSAVAKTVAADLAAAELLVIALDEGVSLEADARDRLEQAIHQLRAQGAGMAILPAASAATELSRFDFLMQAAKEAGVGLLFPPVGSLPAGTDSTVTAIRQRATAMTPVMTRFLTDTHPRPRWEEQASSL